MRCHLLIKIFLRFGTAGLYCVTKGRISLRIFCFSWSADFLSLNRISQDVVAGTAEGEGLGGL